MPEEEPQLSVEVIKAAFQVLDRDGDGMISKEELRLELKRIDQEATEQELNDMMKEADGDGDGYLNLEEFIKIMS
ncbi:EF-hand, partial [Pluteus cervinus]